MGLEQRRHLGVVVFSCIRSLQPLPFMLLAWSKTYRFLFLAIYVYSIKPVVGQTPVRGVLTYILTLDIYLQDHTL